AASHNRVALGYLRTGNTDLAMLEIERLQTAWSAVMGRFAKDRPDVFEPSLYATTVTDISTRLAAADMFLRSGRPEAAAASLSGVRDALSNRRLRSGVTVLADCVLEANARMRALGALDRPPLDWATPQTASQLTGQAKLYRQHLE